MDTGNDARRCDEDQLAQFSWAKDCGMISDEKRRSAVDELLLAATGAYRHVEALDVIANAVGVDISGEGLHDAEEMVYGALADLIDRPTSNTDPVDVFTCPSCGFVGCVVEYQQNGEGYWDLDIPCECEPRFCPNCGAEVMDDGE